VDRVFSVSFFGFSLWIIDFLIFIFNRNLGTLEKLASHVAQVHAFAEKDNMYYCRWEGCLRTDKGFNARYKMLVHSRIHTKDKPHGEYFLYLKKELDFWRINY
jgi:hypothetical protein